MTSTPINIRQKCLGVDERRGLRLTTNVLVAHDYGTERCAKDVDLYQWNRKICNMREYNRAKDQYGTYTHTYMLIHILIHILIHVLVHICT